MLLTLLLAALSETASADGRRAGTHEVARRLGVPWRATPARGPEIPRTRIELWATMVLELMQAHRDNLRVRSTRKQALVLVFQRLHPPNSIRWMKRDWSSPDGIGAGGAKPWVKNVADSEVLHRLFSPEVPTSFAFSPEVSTSFAVFPLWVGERDLFEQQKPLSAFPTFERDKATTFYHIARALIEAPPDRLEEENLGNWGTRITELLDWVDAMHPDLSRMTWAEMEAAATAMHQALLTTTGSLLYRGVLPDAWVLATGPDGWSVQRLLTKAEFAAEGTSMAHCIGGPVRPNGRPDGQSQYFQKSRDNEAIYLSIRQAGLPIATIEITGDPGAWRIEQVQGPQDGEIESDAAAAFVRGGVLLGLFGDDRRTGVDEDPFGKMHRGLGKLPLDEVDPRLVWARSTDWYDPKDALDAFQTQFDLSPSDEDVDDLTHELRTFAERSIRLLGETLQSRSVWTAKGEIPDEGLLVALTLHLPKHELRIDAAVVDGRVRVLSATRRSLGVVLQGVPFPTSLVEAFATLIDRDPVPAPAWTLRATDVAHPDVLERWTDREGLPLVDAWTAPTDVALRALGRSR